MREVHYDSEDDENFWGNNMDVLGDSRKEFRESFADNNNSRYPEECKYIEDYLTLNNDEEFLSRVDKVIDKKKCFLKRSCPVYFFLIDILLGVVFLLISFLWKSKCWRLKTYYGY